MVHKENRATDQFPGKPVCRGARPQEIRYNPETNAYEVLYTCPYATCILKATRDLPRLERGTYQPSEAADTFQRKKREAANDLAHHAGAQAEGFRRGCESTKITCN